MLRVFLSETLNMLDPEEIAPEIGFAIGNSQSPRQHHQRTDRHRQPAVGQHFAPAFTRHHPRQHANHRYRQRQEALGHHPHTAGDSQQDITQHLPAAALRLGGSPEAAHRQRQPHGDHRIQHRIGSDTVYQHRGQEDNQRQNRHAFIAENTPRQPRHQQRADGNGEDRTETHAKVIMTE